jgi:hypothetical protein
MEKRTAYISFLITSLLVIRTLTGWGSETKPLPHLFITKQYVPALLNCLADTVPPQKAEPDKDKKPNAAPQQDPVAAPANNVPTTAKEEVKAIKEVPKSKKKITPVKIDAVPPPQTIIKPKIIIRKL